MNLDELHTEWQTTNEAVATLEQRDRLIATTCRRVERFWVRIFRRDLRETIAALVAIAVFARYCYVAPADYVVSKIGAGFLACWALFATYKLHRARTIQRPAPLDAPVREFCRIELARLDRQIQLQRNVLWWYIAPSTIGANTMFIGLAGLRFGSAVYGLVTLLLACGIYALNMTAVAKELVPARTGLAGLLSQLGETVAPIELPSTRRRVASGIVLLAALSALAIATAVRVGQPAVEYPRRAPFSAIRWEGDEPVVKIGDEWFALVSIDGVAADDIAAFSWRTYVDRWRGHFAEDLVEILARMGHPPREAVTLVVRPRASSKPRTLKNVPMTDVHLRSGPEL